MTNPRSADFDLEKALLDPGFTPRARDIPGLIAWLDRDEDARTLVERALVRTGTAAEAPLLAGHAERGAVARASTLRVLGKLARSAPEGPSAALLLGGLDDSEPRVRRAAARALGVIVGAQTIRAHLLAALAKETDASVVRALALAVAHHGGELPKGLLDTSDPTLQKARVVAARKLPRGANDAPDPARSGRGRWAVRFRCRAGLEDFLAAELPKGAEAAPQGGHGIVDAVLTGSPVALLRARTWLTFSLPLPPTPMRNGDVVDAVARALTSDEAIARFRRFSQGVVRYRLAFADGRKRRADVVAIAARVASRFPDLVNDPDQSPWEAHIAIAPDRVFVELLPQFPDTRFAYRKGDVPAASHPTIAAALAIAAGVRKNDLVWDPFVGSGLELCERSLRGPYGRLLGTDISAEALEKARANLESVGAQNVLLTQADALRHDPGRPTLILTNPPMGRRVRSGGTRDDLLVRMAEKAALVLAPGGRLVWISPLFDETVSAAVGEGLVCTTRRRVDMGGFHAELQILEKPDVLAPKRR